MNQFHTPSFGDEVFELNDSVQPPPESPQQSSRRMLSLDHSTFNDDDEEERHSYGAGQSLMAIEQQQQQPPSQAQPQQIVSQQPAKPLAPFALFFRDTVTAIKQQNPTCSLEQMQAIVQTMWESLDETQKNVYHQQHEQEKRDYVRQMRDYRQQLEHAEEMMVTAPAPTPAAAPAPVPVQEERKPAAVQDDPAVAAGQGQPDQIQLLTEAARVQKCTREQCNKPAIINPDWEDEYCSNECVVIHCRNVFNEWALTLKNSPS
ncbi:hypothetical protein KR018_007118 [Drosophila ironensis]|nr:hypothetical protein KR018_007118 [Drosophila ironensis]